MKIFIGISAVLAWLFGIMLLFLPAAFYMPVGIMLTPLLATVAQAHGATLFGLGALNWLGRKADRKGIIAILTGNLVVQALSFAVIIRTWSLNPGPQAIPGMAIHITLGTLFAVFLYRVHAHKVEIS
ncbi:MAG TPA: hypothetical protein VFR24_25430 [Candidatus Angelobacter sp.]|nr:hypothetical protein [Candidatus Angelobacter sp.]